MVCGIAPTVGKWDSSMQLAEWVDLCMMHLTEKRFIEITTVFQGLHGLDDAKMQYEHQYLNYLNRESTYVCNYR